MDLLKMCIMLFSPCVTHMSWWTNFLTGQQENNYMWQVHTFKSLRCVINFTWRDSLFIKSKYTPEIDKKIFNRIVNYYISMADVKSVIKLTDSPLLKALWKFHHFHWSWKRKWNYSRRELIALGVYFLFWE